MRVFIASFLPNELKGEIIKIQNEIKNYVVAKFVEEENLHISYSFLGEINEEELEIVKRRLKDLEFENSFEIILNSIKLIPSPNFVRVIALDVKSQKGEEIRKWIEENIGGDSKPLHLTLCRVKTFTNKKGFMDYLKSKKINFKFIVNEIAIVKSTLTYSGPIYEKIFSVKLL
ncbi:MAG: RNA 2',3'-cyclic phosphodiesterase [Candidatus Aenigmatarchaeota archaeon]